MPEDHLSLRSLFLRHVAQTSDSPPMIEVERAEGVWLYGPDGKRWMDLISGISVSNVGHCAPEVVAAVREQAGTFMHAMVYGEFVLSPQVRLAKALTAAFDNHIDNVYFVNSGSEAVEGALKLAKKFTGRSGIVAMDRSYHGSTHGALSVTGADWLKEGYGPFLPNVEFISFNSPNDLAWITEETAAVIVEPVRGEAGIELPEPGYLEALAARCREMGAMLICDEIQTGFGRTGSMFAFQEFGIRPDIVTIAKGMGGGMPIGAFCASKEVMQVISRDPILGHISTFGGHPVSCAASLAALEKINREELVKQVPSKEALIRQRLGDLGTLRGKGLLFALELGSFERVNAAMHLAAEKGVITDWFLHCDTALRIAPPLVISEEELSWGLEVIREVVAAV